MLPTGGSTPRSTPYVCCVQARRLPERRALCFSPRGLASAPASQSPVCSLATVGAHLPLKSVFDSESYRLKRRTARAPASSVPLAAQARQHWGGGRSDWTRSVMINRSLSTKREFSKYASQICRAFSVISHLSRYISFTYCQVRTSHRDCYRMESCQNASAASARRNAPVIRVTQ
jgi:hypothetical protein